ncbi:two-component system sensor histidine kinase YesM [Evansella vedderi]|uniref:Two-component system sensor histidine kinase YesM n=1 Tax=Evansella vedderi TaxID=38282 RepID=A0ABT9ZPZ9_9BACI|nr:histidine kinase [Evansella vedderi]MDQ0253279.1 two-component system sensor histidine kinase YesM [Evansella vedderi]
MEQRQKIKDYIQNSFIKATVIIISFILSVYLLSLYIIFNLSIVNPNKEVNEYLTNKVAQEFIYYKEGVKSLSNEEEIIRAVETNTATNVVNQLLYDFQHERKIPSNFALLNRDKEVLSSSLYRDERERLENSFFIENLTNNLNRDMYIEQSVGNLFENSHHSTYFFSIVIKEEEQVLGYLVYFLEDFVVDSSYDQMVFVTDQFDNVIARTHDFRINNLGKLNIDTSTNYVSINGYYFYLNYNTVGSQNIGILTMTSINIYRLLLFYGIASMSVSSLIIILAVLIVTPKILKKTLQPFDTLVSIISNQNNNQTPVDDDNVFDELQTIHEEYNSKINEIKTLIQINKEIMEKKRELEIKHLEAKFNPHFLYNVLEMIKYEITLDPENASEIIVKIAKLMRYNTNFGNVTVPLKTDLEYLEDYFSLQKMRFGKRLEYEIDIPNELLYIHVPKLIIQPLIENAIKHNIDKTNKLSIRLSAHKFNSHLFIVVQDDGEGIEANKLSEIQKVLSGDTEMTDHNGIRNTHNIIQLLYGENYGLQIESKVNRGTLVRLWIPLEEVD